MKLLPALFAFLIVLGALLSAGDLPTIKAAIPDVSTTVLGTIPAIDLRKHFEVTSIKGQVVQFETVRGTFNVEMNATLAPNTVANFLAYVNANRFTNSIIHRSNPFYRILQGGGYLNDSNLTTIAKNAAIAMEASDTLAHSRGTIAMARTAASLNSATSEWFINTADNSGQWAPASAANASSYAAFGRVTGTGMSVVDAIAALPVLFGNVTVTSSSTASTQVTVNAATLPANFFPGWKLLGSTVASVSGNLVTLAETASQTIPPPPVTPVKTSKFGSPIDELPVLQNLPADNSVLLSNLVTVNTMKVVPVFATAAGQASVVAFSVVSNSNPAVVTPSLNGITLSLAHNSLVGTADLVIKATDTNGNSAQTQFRVTVTEVPPKAVGTWTERTVVRDLPTAAGSAVDIGTLTFTGGTGSIEAAVNVNGSGSSVAKRYVIPIRYNLGNGSPAGTWLKALPTHDTGAYGVNDFDLDVNVSGTTASLRLRTVGSNGAAAKARIAIKASGLETFVNSTATAVAAVPALTVSGNAVDELIGNAGIGVAPAGNAALDINGGDTRGLRLRVRTTAGPPTTGTWSKGTMILDKDGNLYICIADSPIGTPAGTWKKVGAP
jgi:cyclophilin family peptidyl-prolyl cis-trans isomerase